MAKLTDEELNASGDDEPADIELDATKANKVTWSNLFMQQPAVQSLLNRYFETLDTMLNKEIRGNTHQLKDFLAYPRRAGSALV